MFTVLCVVSSQQHCAQRSVCMEDVSLLTRVTVNQAGEALTAQVVSKDTKI